MTCFRTWCKPFGSRSQNRCEAPHLHVTGTPLTGGTVSIQGTILGALLITILSKGMNIIASTSISRIS